MEAFLIATGVVALAEIGDKTQLLSLVLATRYRSPWAISGGILVTTIINHALAALVGESVFEWLGPEWTRWILAGSFVVMAGWMLIPDKLDADEENVAENRMKRYGVFVMTTVIFFLLEMGDKTQIATAILAARFQDLTAVVAGSTLGMVIANVPVVFFGDALAKRMPIDMIHRITAGIFLVMGAAILFGIAF